MDSNQKHKILSDILRLTQKAYRKNKEKHTSAEDLSKAEDILKKLN